MLALCIGVYLIFTTALVSKDGITFIKYGQQIESSSVETKVNEDQHPGYPWLILTAHKLTRLLHNNTSILSWIYCAQSVALVFRLLSIVVLYFIAKHLFGAGMSFWAVLILIVLPKPAEYGSDTLSDWPHLFFLLTSFLLLLKGAVNRNWRLFGFSALAAGAGYLIRPECVQMIVMGSLWLGLQSLLPGHTLSKARALPALALLFAGFLAFAWPYMNLKGAVFPKKKVGQFTSVSHQLELPEKKNLTLSKAKTMLQVAPLKITKAFCKIAANIGETLMWFFVPALLLGIYKKLKNLKWYEPEKFFIIAIIGLNIPVMIWLHYKHGYMSDRHTLPLLIIPILYIPLGLQEFAVRLQKLCSAKVKSSGAINFNERFWFLLLLLIGVSICSPKLLRPIRAEKQGFRAAAEWLKKNTDSDAIIAVPDRRISFYAGRKELYYENRDIPKKAEYLVKIYKKKTGKLTPENPSDKLVYKYIDKRRRIINTAIYKRL